jgi:hypothetical protein
VEIDAGATFLLMRMEDRFMLMSIVGRMILI